jgi:hypothetical protein
VPGNVFLSPFVVSVTVTSVKATVIGGVVDEVWTARPRGRYRESGCREHQRRDEHESTHRNLVEAS